jgi:V/A-type H+-transporting ATPase subunit A
MQTQTTGKVRGIIANLLTIEVDGPVAQNEICFIHLGDTRLMAEVIKVTGKNASAQVYESTRGLRVGDHVTFAGHMLEVQLGPGLLSSNYDGLQNNLATMDGVFLKKGEYTEPIDRETAWDFKPLAKAGDKVTAGDWLGEVMEGWLTHRIMVPFTMTETYTVEKVTQEGSYTVDQTVAVLKDDKGQSHPVTMVQDIEYRTFFVNTNTQTGVKRDIPYNHSKSNGNKQERLPLLDNPHGNKSNTYTYH